MSAGPDITSLLPPSLNLPPHLSAHKYFFVCTLTVAAWDTLVLSPRAWRLSRTKEWPLLKIIFHFLRVFMPVEFAIVAVAFFDTKFTETQCSHFYLFEPICTAILVSSCSLIHFIRINALYPSSQLIKSGLLILFTLQVAVMAVLCGFYRPMPLQFPAPPMNSGQGCIAGPKFADREWVGLYWAFPTLFFTATFALALARSIGSLQNKQMSAWKLMLRDGLNLYGAIWVVNMVNVLFWFIAKPTGEDDSIKTIVTSMAAVLTTTMSLRIVLSIRGSLGGGGNFNGGSLTASGTQSHSHSHSRSAAIPSNAHGHGHGGNVIAINRPQTFTISHPGTNNAPIVNVESKTEWDDADGKSNASVQYKEGGLGLGTEYDDAEDDARHTVSNPNPTRIGSGGGLGGVKVTIDRHVDDGGFARAR